MALCDVLEGRTTKKKHMWGRVFSKEKLSVKDKLHSSPMFFSVLSTDLWIHRATEQQLGRVKSVHVWIVSFV